MIADKILDLINSFDTITIFSHVNPDYDALGSSMGLKQAILDNFENKKVFVLQEKNLKNLPSIDVIDDEICKNSLGIILDTPNFDRISIEQYQLCKKLILIDHHPKGDIEADVIFSNIEYSSTSEMVTKIIKDLKFRLTKETATYLYMGLLTDTLSFKTNNTTSHTLSMASYLATSDINISEINRKLFDISLKDYRFKSYLCANIVVDKNFGYIILSKDILNEFQINHKDAKNFVNTFGNIIEINIWALFVESDNGTYEGSIRSKMVTINELAKKYNGGGHKNASGVRNMNYQDMERLIEELTEYSIKEN